MTRPAACLHGAVADVVGADIAVVDIAVVDIAMARDRAVARHLAERIEVGGLGRSPQALPGLMPQPRAERRALRPEGA